MDKLISCRQVIGPNGYASLWTRTDMPFQALVETVGKDILIWRVRSEGNKIERLSDQPHLKIHKRASNIEIRDAVLRTMGADEDFINELQGA